MMLLPPHWVLPPAEPTLTGNAVHVWVARLDVSGARLQGFSEMLSPDERQRAEKFLYDQHRAYFIAGRGLLRSILGQYLRVAPAAIRFIYNPYGKPALEPLLGQDAFYFNVSHSNGVALFAFSRGGEIGADIEFMHDRTDMEQTGAIVFSPTELTALRALPPEQRRPAFFQYWTRKEAFIKATGQGFSLPLLKFDISHTPEKPVANIVSPAEPPQFTNWHVRDISLLQGYAAAIAREGNEWPVSFFSMPDLNPF